MSIKKYKAIAFIVFAAATSACATTYGPMGEDGGFSDLRVSESVYRVNVRGNGSTTREMVQNFALLRASELTLAAGQQRFVIISEDVRNSASMVSNGNGSSTTNVSNGDVSTSYTAPSIETITKAGGTMVIEIVGTQDPRFASAYDAALVDRQLRPELERSWWQWK